MSPRLTVLGVAALLVLRWLANMNTKEFVTVLGVAALLVLGWLAVTNIAP